MFDAMPLIILGVAALLAGKKSGAASSSAPPAPKPGDKPPPTAAPRPPAKPKPAKVPKGASKKSPAAPKVLEMTPVGPSSEAAPELGDDDDVKRPFGDEPLDVEATDENISDPLVNPPADGVYPEGVKLTEAEISPPATTRAPEKPEPAPVPKTTPAAKAKPKKKPKAAPKPVAKPKPAAVVKKGLPKAAPKKPAPKKPAAKAKPVQAKATSQPAKPAAAPRALPSSSSSSSSSKRAPKQAALDLKAYVSKPGANFGTKGNPSSVVRDAQRDMGNVTADGIYGPATRSRGAQLGVSLPPRK